MIVAQWLLFKQWLLYKLCSSINHRGPGLTYAIDETGNFMFYSCNRCRTLIFEALNKDMKQDDYLKALTKWF